MGFKHLGMVLNYMKFKLADRNEIAEITGHKAEAIPLIGHGLPCFIDKSLLVLDCIYGGTGDAFHTLKINPEDMVCLVRITILPDECFV